MRFRCSTQNYSPQRASHIYVMQMIAASVEQKCASGFPFVSFGRIQTSMYTGAVGMAIAASLATLDLQIVSATMLTLAAALTSYKHTVWDGHNRDSGQCVPMHQTSFEIFKVAGKGNGLFSSCHISKV